MAHYTLTIRTLMNSNFDFKMDKYPIFDENYRNTLNNNILNHYYMSEIGFETAPLFRHYLNQTLNEIMPKYNEMYKAQIEILKNNNLLNNVNLTENFKRKIDSKTNGKSNSKYDSKNVYQDTPAGKIDMTNVDNFNWASSVTMNKNNDESLSEGTANNLEDYVKTITGNNGSKYVIDLLTDVKNNFYNIDLLIINELETLFMGIF